MFSGDIEWIVLEVGEDMGIEIMFLWLIGFININLKEE